MGTVTENNFSARYTYIKALPAAHYFIYPEADFPVKRKLGKLTQFKILVKSGSSDQ